MAITGRADSKLKMARIRVADVARRNKLTGYHINQDAEIEIFNDGLRVSMVYMKIDENMPYFCVEDDLKKYSNFEEAYKEAMTKNGYPVYYEKVM